MLCIRCENQLQDCTCENLEERLDEAVASGHFDYKKCAKCSKHYARCKCEEPQFMLASQYNMLKDLNNIIDKPKKNN